jgi:hypothetical protein
LPFLAFKRFQLPRPEKNENDDEDDFRNEGEKGELLLASSRGKAERFAYAQTSPLERIALVPRQSFLNIVLVVVLVLDFFYAAEKLSRWFHRLRSF